MNQKKSPFGTGKSVLPLFAGSSQSQADLDDLLDKLFPYPDESGKSAKFNNSDGFDVLKGFVDGLEDDFNFEAFRNLQDWDYLSADERKGLAAPSALPPKLRPYEKLTDRGPEALSDRELLTVLLKTGVRDKNVSVVACDLLDHLNSSNEIPQVKELAKLTGIGRRKASAIVAMLEFGKRRWGCRGTRVRGAIEMYDMIRHYAESMQEQFLCISLNVAHEVIAVRVITKGSVNRTVVHPREVFADAILDRASAVCVAHNHPSGRALPSKEDDEITEMLAKAADVLCLHFLDHIIFTKDSYYSYNTHGKLKNRR
ncbi:MAG: hypothetical protein Ta2G_09510 [Termitinemataceae bacterium]|nr:MAG: hypothetical protein Ta2G_09510 [Termitinemataceae bacterium]